MKRVFAAAVVAAALAVPARHAAAQSVGQDVKNAGKDVGHAGATVGKDVAHGAVKGATAVKTGAVDAADATADAAKATGKYVKARVTPSKRHHTTRRAKRAKAAMRDSTGR